MEKQTDYKDNSHVNKLNKMEACRNDSRVVLVDDIVKVATYDETE